MTYTEKKEWAKHLKKGDHVLIDNNGQLRLCVVMKTEWTYWKMLDGSLSHKNCTIFAKDTWTGDYYIRSFSDKDVVVGLFEKKA